MKRILICAALLTSVLGVASVVDGFGDALRLRAKAPDPGLDDESWNISAAIREAEARGDEPEAARLRARRATYFPHNPGQ